MSSNLDRFRQAQDAVHGGFATALAEIRAGRKQSHWIWYVFPQLGGLGSSPMAVRYALASPEEAVAYVDDPVLAERLVTIAEAAARHLAARPPIAIRGLMGSSIDALKLVSSMTLFAKIAEPRAAAGDELATRLATAATTLLRAAEAEGIPACAHTLASLKDRAR